MGDEHLAGAEQRARLVESHARARRRVVGDDRAAGRGHERGQASPGMPGDRRDMRARSCAERRANKKSPAGKASLRDEVGIELAERAAGAFMLADDLLGGVAQRIGIFPGAALLGEAARGLGHRHESEPACRADDILGKARGLVPFLLAAGGFERLGEFLGGCDIALQDVDERRACRPISPAC